MNRTRIASLTLSVLMLLALVMQPAINAQALPTTVYNAIPAVLPYNMASMGFQATQTAEFGDYIHLAGTDRVLQSVTVTMSDWAKNSEYPLMPAAGFDHPITVNIYSVTPGSPLNTVGTLLGTVTQTKTIPWRPEADPTCPGGTAWRAADNQCYNGLAFNLTFDMSSLNLTLPDDIIVGIAYNTQTWGAAPLGVAGPYNSLNVGAEGTLTTGTDDNTDNVFFNTSTAGWYTDGGAGGVGIFREDTNWTPYGTIPLQIVTGPPPAPVADITPTELQFGNVLLGTTSTSQTVTLTNSGDANLNIVGAQSATGMYDFTTDCGAFLAPSASCHYYVTFTPPGLGDFDSNLMIYTDAATSPDLIPLYGTGVAVPNGANLLLKSDFSSASIFPVPWSLFGVRRPYGSAVDCTVFQTAACSVHFPAGNRSAMQRVIRPGGLAGDMYNFGLSSTALNAGGVYRVEVTFYNNDNRRVGTSSLNFTPGTHGWETIRGFVSATGNYNRIIFRFYYASPSGSAWFDDAFLMIVP